MKAVFLFNFSRFVDWPPQTFVAPDAPFVIGVLGADPFGPELEEVVRGERAHGRPLAVRRFQRPEEIEHCQILYISRSEQRRLDTILKQLAGRSILTVGDAEDFAQRGVMIRLQNESNRVRLHINLKAAEAAGLTISSKLLRPATIIETGS